jgi:hypothetical protein
MSEDIRQSVLVAETLIDASTARPDVRLARAAPSSCSHTAP